ncbi:MAG: HesA/MoeB/ThiF family protein [Woeseiaceae bacterium]|jgi:molybdopterin/thiamine biosynthesis adenylyltransferase|nr:HesA/MoeB/ThiF family protein [Woeseiaceae bacterium]
MNRSARQIALAQIGASGQTRIAESTVLIIGLGGIGCATASYLACAGVGQLLLCDFDTVDETNLGRQTLYGPSDVGELKAIRAASRLAAMNPDVRLTEISDRLSDAAMNEAVNQADLVLDGCDNFATRFQVNSAAVTNNTRLISGAAIRFEGQIATFGSDFSKSPCYRCLYQEADETLDNCSGNGVLGPVPGVIGTMMAVEALKSLAGVDVRTGVLSLYDALSGDWQKVSIRKRKKCPACGNT